VRSDTNGKAELTIVGQWRNADEFIIIRSCNFRSSQMRTTRQQATILSMACGSARRHKTSVLAFPWTTISVAVRASQSGGEEKLGCSAELRNVAEFAVSRQFLLYASRQIPMTAQDEREQR
jgi:hypothetical protein